MCVGIDLGLFLVSAAFGNCVNCEPGFTACHHFACLHAVYAYQFLHTCTFVYNLLYFYLPVSHINPPRTGDPEFQHPQCG